jgi:hypothetical protein
MQEMRRDRSEPVEVSKSCLGGDGSALHLIVRFEDPGFRHEVGIDRKVSEEVLERRVASEEMAPRFVEGGEEATYAREM